MTSEQPEISEERIRQFAKEGGMDPDQIDTFLDSQCYEMTLILPPQVMLDVVEEGTLTRKAAVIGCQERQPNMHVMVWCPKPHHQEIFEIIRGSFKDRLLEPPHELLDLESMDSATTGREYIRSMLQGCVATGVAI